MTSMEKTQSQTHVNLTVFMLVKTMPEWLGMPVAERFAHFNGHMEPILKKYENDVHCRIFDTESPHASPTSRCGRQNHATPMKWWSKNCGRRRCGIASSRL